jgi:ubiquinone/menaquinone biosynthesis C-methylase UbiE
LENEIVEKYLEESNVRGARVLDVPTGTGRFLKMFTVLGASSIVGIDSSNEMLALARKKKIRNAVLKQGDIRNLGDERFDIVVCVRYLDLIDQEAMRTAVREITRVASKAVILTIRLGDEYVLKSNTATHCEKAFQQLVQKLKWRVDRSETIFDAGWRVLKLIPKGDNK